MLSAVVGVAVAVVAFLGAYRSLQDSYGIRRDEYHARRVLDALEGEIEGHRKSVGHLPTSLAEIKLVKEGALARNDGEGRPLDPWGQPFQ